MPVEQARQQLLAAAGDLALCERPQREVVDPPWQRVADGRDAAQVGRPGEQKLAPGGVAIDARLDCQQQLRRALHLVDHHWPLACGDEAGGVGQRQRAHRLVVERQILCAQPLLGEHPRECALPRLPRPEQRHDPRRAHRLDHHIGQPALDQRHQIVPVNSEMQAMLTRSLAAANTEW